jgi:hypothetical protein
VKHLGALCVLFLAGCTRVDTTEHCILTRYGDVVEEKMGTGLTFTPLTDATCFSLTEQNFPSGNTTKEVVEAQTRDPVTVQGDVAIVYSYDPATIVKVFREKRTPDAVETEVVNSIREGYRNALASWTVSDIFSARRASLSDSVRAHIQRKIGDRAQIRQVFVRDIRIPQQIEAARIDAARQAQVLDQARKQFTIDSVNSAAVVLKARAESESKRLEAQAYGQNPKLLDLRIAEAMAGICRGSSTCVLGGSIMDAWMGGGPKR